MSRLPPLALYIHIPWCERKCPYCDFNSHVEPSAHTSQEPTDTQAIALLAVDTTQAPKATIALPEHDYVQCLLRDLQSQMDAVQSRSLSSIFIGGGTPSLFSADAIASILSGVEALIPFSDDIEVTMEANPGSAEAQKFAALFQAGVNRLSIGVQSFDDGCLQRLGRIHNRDNAMQAVKLAQAAGFKRINVDLMHGLPEQSQAMAVADIQQALDLGVEHISWYQLTIEQNTEFYRYPPQLPEDDALADIQQAGAELLAANGFSQYEISAFSKGNAQARHNINYWQFGDYLAIGAGAHGKVTLLSAEGLVVSRFNKTRLPRDYMLRTDDFNAQYEQLASEDLLFESLMNCLRLNEGMQLQDCLDYTGATMADLQRMCQPAIDKKLLQIDDRIKATPLGRQYLNTLLESLLPSAG